MSQDEPKTYVVFCIGCIECGNYSEIVARFDDRDKADFVAQKLNENANWLYDGQNKYDVFDVPGVSELNIVDEFWQRYVSGEHLAVHPRDPRHVDSD